MRVYNRLFTIVLVLSGCSDVIHRPFTIREPTRYGVNGVSLDAKQRVILLRKTANSNTEYSFCAEPSPDVAVALAAALTLEGGPAEAKGKVAAGIAEKVGNLGTRSQTIQILRDGLYRACEARGNGDLTNEEYKEILYGFDDFVITLVAIDALTQRTELGPITFGDQRTVEDLIRIASTTPAQGKSGNPGADADQKNKGGEAGTTPGQEAAGGGGAKTAVLLSDTVVNTVKEIVLGYYKHQKELYAMEDYSIVFQVVGPLDDKFFVYIDPTYLQDTEFVQRNLGFLMRTKVGWDYTAKKWSKPTEIHIVDKKKYLPKGDLTTFKGAIHPKAIYRYNPAKNIEDFRWVNVDETKSPPVNYVPDNIRPDPPQ